MTNSILQRAAVTMLLAASFGLANAADVPVTLTGDQEVPAVTTDAKATGKLTIKADKSVSGKITTTGIESTVAHIQEAAPGKNGPPIITLEKGADSSFSVPAGSKLTDEQYKSFKAGNLYVNRGITGAIGRRQPFGGWKRSSVGASAKAGGANYVFTLGNWVPTLVVLSRMVNLRRKMRIRKRICGRNPNERKKQHGVRRNLQIEIGQAVHENRKNGSNARK